MRSTWIVALCIAVALALGAWFLFEPQEEPSVSYTYANASSDLIRVSGVERVSSGTLRITGEARGYWYFEASFPVEIQDAGGATVAAGSGAAQGEWMTEEFVPFVAEISLSSYSGSATVVLRKDNPSAMPENDASVSFPITL